MITPELQIDIGLFDLGDLLGEELGELDSSSSRYFHTRVLQEAAPQYNLPGLTVRNTNWQHTSFTHKPAPDVGYVLNLATLDLSSARTIERQKIHLFDEWLPYREAVRLVAATLRSFHKIELDAFFRLLNPGYTSEATMYQKPFGELDADQSNKGPHESYAANLLVESLLRGTTIAEAGKIDDASMVLHPSLFSRVNDYSGLVVAVRDPTVERVNAAVPEFRAFGEYLGAHREAFRNVISALAPAESFRWGHSETDERPRIYASADRLLQNIERPKLKILAVPNGQPVLPV